MEEVAGEERSSGESREDHGDEGVGEKEDEREIGGSAREGETVNDWREFERGRERTRAHRKRSRFFKMTTSFLKKRW